MCTTRSRMLGTAATAGCPPGPPPPPRRQRPRQGWLAWLCHSTSVRAAALPGSRESVTVTHTASTDGGGSRRQTRVTTHLITIIITHTLIRRLLTRLDSTAHTHRHRRPVAGAAPPPRNPSQLHNRNMVQKSQPSCALFSISITAFPSFACRRRPRRCPEKNPRILFPCQTKEQF
jgi:hypothetical protein